MELDGDVDVSEFPASELRRQQMQSYIIKVLLPGTEDAVKIQHYHRLAVLFENAAKEFMVLLEANPNVDHSDTEFGHLAQLYEENEALHVEVANLVLLNNDNEMLTAVFRFVSAVNQDIRILATTEEAEADMAEKVLTILRREPVGSVLSVYAMGLMALLLRPQEYEVDAVRYVAATEVPEQILKRLQSLISARTRGGSASSAALGPFTREGNPIESSQEIVYTPASVNEEVDAEEPKLADLSVNASWLRWSECSWMLEILQQVGQYVEVLAPVLQNGGVEIIHFLLTSQSPTLVTNGLYCLAALFTHPKFTFLFLARDGLLLLLSRPGNPDPSNTQYIKIFSVVLNNLVQFPNTIEQLCLLHEQILSQFIDLVFWLIAIAHEEPLKPLLICLSRLLLYETVIDIFQRQKHFATLMDLWHFFQQIVDGKIGSDANSQDMINGVPIVDLQTPVFRRTRDGIEVQVTVPPPEARPARVPVPARPTGASMDTDDEAAHHESDFQHLRVLSPASARSLIDHILLVVSEYFSATCVQEITAFVRQASFGSSNLNISAATPRYRATTVSYEHMATLDIAHYRIDTLPSVNVFIKAEGLNLLFATLHSNLSGVPHSQTSCDILAAGLKTMWVLSTLHSVSIELLNLKFTLPEASANASLPPDNFTRQLVARVQEALRENPHRDDIPIVHGLNGHDPVRRRNGDEEEVPENEGQANGGGGGGYMDRADLSNIRLEPVNQRLALQRASSRQGTGQGANAPPQDAPAAATNGDAAAEPLPAPPAATEPNPAPPQEPDNPQTHPKKSKTKSAFSMLMMFLKRLSNSANGATSALYVLNVFKSYVHLLECPSCHKRYPANVIQLIPNEIRANNGLAELSNLLKFHDISVSTHSAQMKNLIVTDWNIIRFHAMAVLRGLAKADQAIRQILSKKLHNSLPELLRAPIPPGLEKSFAKFKDEAISFLTTTGAITSYKRDEQNFGSQTKTLSKFERTGIISSTPIRYKQQDLLELIYQHLSSSGLNKAAQALLDEAKLKPEAVRVAPTPSSTRTRNRRQSMLTTPASMLTATPGLTQPPNPDLPHSDAGFLGDQSSNISLDMIMKQYLFEQHKHCRHPVQILPDLSLHAKHACVEPSRFRMNPYGLSSMNMAHRMMAHRIQAQPLHSPMWRRYKYSRFAPRRKFADGGRLTSVTFVGEDTLMFGSGEGMVVKFNLLEQNYDSEWEVRDGGVDIKVSIPAQRVLTLSSLPSLLDDAASDMEIWDLQNMGHSLGHLPYVTGNFSTNGSEVIGTNATSLISLWDVASSTVVRSFHDPHQDDSKTMRLDQLQPGCFSPDDCLVLSNSTLFDKRQSNPVHSFDRFATHGGQIFAPSGLEVITNTEIWDSRTFKLIKTLPSLHKAQLHFSHAGDILFAGGRNRFETWDTATYDYISQVTLESSFGSLSINPADSLVAVLENLGPGNFTAADTAWRLWDIGTTRPLDDEEASDEEEGDGEEPDELEGFETDDDDDDQDGDDHDDFGGHHHHHHHGHDDEEIEDNDEMDVDSDEFTDEVSDEEGDIQFDSDGDVIGSDEFEDDYSGEVDDEEDVLLVDEDGNIILPEYLEDDPRPDRYSRFQLADSDDEAAILQGSEESGSISSQSESFMTRRSGGSSAFAELPSDEEKATRFLEHGELPTSSEEPSVAEPGSSDMDVSQEASATSESQEEQPQRGRRRQSSTLAALFRRLRENARGQRRPGARQGARAGRQARGPTVEEVSDEEESSAEVQEQRRFAAKRAGTAPPSRPPPAASSSNEEEAPALSRSSSKQAKKK